MKSIEVKGTARTIAERSSEQARALKEMRKNGGVPCVLYGGNEVVHFTVTNEGLRNLVYTPHIYVVDLVIDGKKVNAILKDIQFHPVTENILHVDFIELFDDKPVTMQVPVKITGHSAGVRAGGVLVVNARKLQVRALPANLPDVIEVDITDLNIGDKSFVRTLQKENYKIMAADNYIVAYVKTSRNAAKNAAAAEGAAESK